MVSSSNGAEKNKILRVDVLNLLVHASVIDPIYLVNICKLYLPLKRLVMNYVDSLCQSLQCRAHLVPLSSILLSPLPPHRFMVTAREH